jgi:hypothetical protein
VIESGPTAAIDGVVRWRLVDLCQWIWEEFRVGIAKQTLSRELRAMGYRKLSARPRHHAQADGAIEDFKKASPRLWTSSHATKKIDPAAIEVWFADEARVGQKNKITRRWARRGSRPSAPHDQRTALDLYLRRHLPQGRQGRGSCLAPLQHRGDEPASGRDRDGGGAGGLTPCSSSTRPGWHLSDKLIVPPNITLVPLPPKCPELNPVENVWQFIRDNWLSNRVFRSDILEHCCFAWNKLVDQPWTIMSIGLRDWAQRF